MDNIKIIIYAKIVLYHVLLVRNLTQTVHNVYMQVTDKNCHFASVMMDISMMEQPFVKHVLSNALHAQVQFHALNVNLFIV